jgi:hypothetical protein
MIMIKNGNKALDNKVVSLLILNWYAINKSNKKQMVIPYIRYCLNFALLAGCFLPKATLILSIIVSMIKSAATAVKMIFIKIYGFIGVLGEASIIRKSLCGKGIVILFW